MLASTASPRTNFPPLIQLEWLDRRTRVWPRVWSCACKSLVPQRTSDAGATSEIWAIWNATRWSTSTYTFRMARAVWVRAGRDGKRPWNPIWRKALRHRNKWLKNTVSVYFNKIIGSQSSKITGGVVPKENKSRKSLYLVVDSQQEYHGLMY